MVATRRSLALAEQTPKVQQESAAELPAKSAEPIATEKKRERKRKIEEVKEDAGEEQEKPAENASDVPQVAGEKSKRAKRRQRGALKRQAEGKTRGGNPRQESKDNDES